MSQRAKIIRAEWRAYCLPLRQPWQTVQGVFDQRRGWLIQLHDNHGHVGLGDCAPLVAAGTESCSEAEVQLAGVINRLTQREPGSVLAELDALVATPAARCGLEMAVLDLLAQEENRSVAGWLNPDAAESVAVNQNAGTLVNLLAAAQEPGRGIIKVKVGLATVAEELQQLRRLVQRYPAVRFRLDANRAWCQADAEQFIQGCQMLPVESIESIESIEEPLQHPDLDKLAELQAQTAVPLALDESLVDVDWPQLLSCPPIRRVVLKPMREGGLAAAANKAAQARAAGMECVVTTSVDSAVGVWATLHLAAAVENIDQGLAHGLATSSWLQRDLLPPPAVVHGRIYLPDRPGFGIDLDQIKIV